MGTLKHYVTEQELSCVEKNGIYPQDIQKTPDMYLTFGSVGLTCTKFTLNFVKTKHINDYRAMSADEINTEFANME